MAFFDNEEDPNVYDPISNPGGSGTGLPQPAPNGGDGNTTPIDPRTGQPVVGGGIDPYGQSPDDPNYGYPPGQGPSTNYGRGWGTPTPTPTPTPSPVPGSNGANYPGLPNPADFPAPDPLAPWTGTFKAPTADEASAQPGFQFELGQGLQALQRGAASKGTLLTGGAQKGLASYAVGAANANYKDFYDEAYNTYDSNRTDFLTNEANRYNSQRTNRNDSFGIDSSYFNMGQAQRLNDFNIYEGNDMNTFSKLLQLANLTRPVTPTYYTGA